MTQGKGVLIVLLLGLLFMTSAATFADTGSSIPYKTDGVADASMLFRVFISLLLVLALGVAALVLFKKYYLKVTITGLSRITLIELKRLSPKLTIYRVGIDENEYVIAQSTDHLVVLDKTQKHDPQTTDKNTE